MEDHFIFISQQQSYTLFYESLEGLNFGELQNLDNGYEILFNRIANGLRGILIVPFILNVYQSGILSFFVYILGVSALAMILKFGNSTFITYKEMFNIMVFSTLLPIVVMIIVGFIIPAFSMIIFNMGTPLWAYIIYKKHVIPGLQSNSNK